MAEIDITSQIVNNLYTEDGVKVELPKIELPKEENNATGSADNTGQSGSDTQVS